MKEGRIMAKSYDHNVQVFDDGLIISVSFADPRLEMRIAIDCDEEQVTVYPIQNQPWRPDALTMNKVYDILTSLTPEELKRFKAQVNLYYGTNIIYAQWMLYQINYIEWKRSNG